MQPTDGVSIAEDIYFSI